MYTNYTNNYNTSHIAYPEGLTLEEQHVEWAIFAALQPTSKDITTTATRHHTSTLADLHTYPIKYLGFSIQITSVNAPTILSASGSKFEHASLSSCFHIHLFQ